jgi:uncharacterized membrane protein YukC
MRRRLAIIVLILIAVLVSGFVAYDAFSAKSDQERMEEACGAYSQTAWIEPDGTVCCDLCVAAGV